MFTHVTNYFRNEFDMDWITVFTCAETVSLVTEFI